MKKTSEQDSLERLHIELDLDCPTHIPVEKMIEIVFQASQKQGLDAHLALKHFRFTEEEIRDYFERIDKKPGVRS